MSVIIKRLSEDSAERKPLDNKLLTSKKPTWCAGCGDFGVLGAYRKVLQNLGYPHEDIVTLAGIGCSSRFPFFVNTHGGQLMHGRALPFASGLTLSRPDLKVFVFGGDGDGFSIGGNHLDHCARKNFNLTYIIMDNNVYGMTKNQTSPTTPLGNKSKTDPSGAIDQPINPMKRLIACGATFVARATSTNMKSMEEIFERAARHNGFAVVEVLSECVQFNEGSFDDVKGLKGDLFPGVPADHDLTDSAAAFRLADSALPGYFGVFYQVEMPTKIQNENRLIESAKSRYGEKPALAHLQKSFAALR